MIKQFTCPCCKNDCVVWLGPIYGEELTYFICKKAIANFYLWWRHLPSCKLVGLQDKISGLIRVKQFSYWQVGRLAGRPSGLAVVKAVHLLASW